MDPIQNAGTATEQPIEEQIQDTVTGQSDTPIDSVTTGTGYVVTEGDLKAYPELKDEGVGVGDKVTLPNVGEEEVEEEDSAQNRDTGNLYTDGILPHDNKV